MHGHYTDVPQDTRSGIFAYYPEHGLLRAANAGESGWTRLHGKGNHLAFINMVDSAGTTRVNTPFSEPLAK